MGFGGVGFSCAGFGEGRGTAFFVVLFVLLVIILRAGI
jgi:uncharacterized protein (TIGR01732 family)